VTWSELQLFVGEIGSSTENRKKDAKGLGEKGILAPYCREIRGTFCNQGVLEIKRFTCLEYRGRGVAVSGSGGKIKKAIHIVTFNRGERR